MELAKKFTKVHFITMIDNIALAASDEREFEEAKKLFEQRCADVGLSMVKEQETHASSPPEQVTVVKFLGEEFAIDTQNGCTAARNRARSVEKLHLAYTHLQKAIVDTSTAGIGGPTVTARQFIACLSLTCWLAHYGEHRDARLKPHSRTLLESIEIGGSQL